MSGGLFAHLERLLPHLLRVRVALKLHADKHRVDLVDHSSREADVAPAQHARADVCVGLLVVHRVRLQRAAGIVRTGFRKFERST